MACYVCHYKRLNCTEGCPFARFFDEGNISIYDKISCFQHHHVLKEKLRPCSMEEGQRLIEEYLLEADARIINLDLCNPCRFLEAYDCKGEQCDLRQFFGTESGFAKLEAILHLKTKRFFLSNFRKAGGKKAARVDAWYKEAVKASTVEVPEAVRASTVEVPAYEEDKASFNRVKEAMGADWVRNEFRAFVIEITTKAAEAARAAAQGAEAEAVAEEEEVEAETVAEEVEPEAVAEEVDIARTLLLLRPPPAEEVVPEAAATSTPLLPPAAEAVATSTPLLPPAAEAVAASTPLLLPAPAGRSRRGASILAEQRIIAIQKKEEEEDKKEQEEDNEDED